MPNYKFSKRSLNNLATCHHQIQDLFNEVIKHYDCTVIEGHRTKERQIELYLGGQSKLTWPNSKHNTYPSMAADVVPYPIDWRDTKRFYYFGGLVKGIATQMGIDIRWGGDWDGDNSFKDQSFNDTPHFELTKI